MRRSCSLLLLSAALLFWGSGCGKHEPIAAISAVQVSLGMGWRGDGTGIFVDANPPSEWSLEENVIWRTPLPAWSNASPVLAGNRVFVCAEPTTLLCIDAIDGRILWSRSNSYIDLLPPEQAAQARSAADAADKTRAELQRTEQMLRRHKNRPDPALDEAAREARQKELEQRIEELKQQSAPVKEFDPPQTQVSVNGYSTPTPTTDGQYVWVLFGNGIAACYDLDGNRRWARVIERPVNEYGQSASPLLADGKLLVLIQKLHALDPATGKTLWEAPAKQGWGSPIIVSAGVEPSAVLPGGEIIRLRDGHVLSTKSASVGYNSPVASGNTVFYIEGKAHAVQLTPSKKPDKIELNFLWNIELPGERYYASPVVYGGLVFAVSQRGDFMVIDAATGTIVQHRQLEMAKDSTFYSSLALAGGKIFATADDGTTHVITADRETRILEMNPIAPIRSSLVFSGKRIYARTLDALWCIGE